MGHKRLIHSVTSMDGTRFLLLYRIPKVRRIITEILLDAGARLIRKGGPRMRNHTLCSYI